LCEEICITKMKAIRILKFEGNLPDGHNDIEQKRTEPDSV